MKTFASRPHYEAHLAPVAALVPDLPDVALVASYKDLVVARRHAKRIVLMQHGAGQSYSDRNPGYPGGSDNDAVGLFLTPNEHSANRWREAYPGARVEIVGTPRLDDLPRRKRTKGPVVAFAFHWDSWRPRESGSAFAHFRSAIRDVAEEFEVIGHGHPRRSSLPRFYRKAGIEHVPDFDDVCRRADVLVADNTSVMFEFASTGRPVVVLNAPWYRRDVNHGLRFWDASTVGIEVSVPGDLVPAISRALEKRPEDVAAREKALDIVYTHRAGAAQRAADAIRAWA